MISAFYQTRIRRFAEEENACKRQNVRYAWLRLLTVVAAIVSATVLYPISGGLGVAAVFLSLSAFAVCLKRHLASIERQQQKERLKIINRQELNCLEGDFSAYDPGSRYEDAQHYCTSDLDIFGAYSIFRYLNRTTSLSGSDMLAGWLEEPAATAEIRARQEAVKELAGMVDLRQEIQAVGLKYQDAGRELPGFLQWLHGKAGLPGGRRLLRTMQILPWVTLAVILAAIAGLAPSALAWLPVTAHLVIYGSMTRKINSLHRQVSRKVEFIGTYSGLVELIVNAGFVSPYLVRLRNCFVESDALQQIRALQNRIGKLDYRLNMFYIPVNILFFFDSKHLAWLDRWRAGAGRKLPEWFDAAARVEALSSFANLQYNHPAWVMPQIRDEYFALDAKDVGHPLIADRERVCNDFSLNGAGRVAIVTGSNMSGKSTFERSIGVNMVMALAGAPVCASAFAVTNCRVYACMRITDSLEEHLSSFHAELKRLKQLIEITRDGGQVFFLLDEMLRGTNSRDRQNGSMAFVRQLAKQGASGIIATHDLALAELEKELPHNVINAHFDVQISGEDMSFDYKLHRGICTGMNASILMKKIGIDID